MTQRSHAADFDRAMMLEAARLLPDVDVVLVTHPPAASARVVTHGAAIAVASAAASAAARTLVATVRQLFPGAPRPEELSLSRRAGPRAGSVRPLVSARVADAIDRPGPAGLDAAAHAARRRGERLDVAADRLGHATAVRISGRWVDAGAHAAQLRARRPETLPWPGGSQ